ncbi:hypothetical protein EDB89DRAFT_2232734 [Lactarius sanguifluus]|nr:hypothetical protein EDB89DRAFT_2232734 [Lactarius sanguifluus]
MIRLGLAYSLAGRQRQHQRPPMPHTRGGDGDSTTVMRDSTAGQPVNFLKDSDDMPTPNDNDDNSEATDDDDSEATNDDDSEATDDDSDVSDGDSDVTDDNSDATDDNTDATGDNSDATDNAQRWRGAVTTRMGQALY